MSLKTLYIQVLFFKTIFIFKYVFKHIIFSVFLFQKWFSSFLRKLIFYNFGRFDCDHLQVCHLFMTFFKYVIKNIRIFICILFEYHYPIKVKMLFSIISFCRNDFWTLNIIHLNLNIMNNSKISIKYRTYFLIGDHKLLHSEFIK